MKTIIALLILCSTPFSLFAAYNWSDDDFNIILQTTNNAVKSIKLSDPNGHVLSIKYQNSGDEQKFSRIVALNTIFRSWQNINIKALNFNIQNNIVSTSILLTSYQIDGKDLKSGIPSGLFFTDDSSLQYNFRVSTNRIFVRVKGIYKNEPELSAKIKTALDNPIDYLEKYDPEYFFRQLVLLKETIKKLNAQVVSLTYFTLLQSQPDLKQSRAFNKTTIRKIIDIVKKDPDISTSRIKSNLANEDITIQQDTISKIVAVIQ